MALLNLAEEAKSQRINLDFLTTIANEAGENVYDAFQNLTALIKAGLVNQANLGKAKELIIWLNTRGKPDWNLKVLAEAAEKGRITKESLSKEVFLSLLHPDTGLILLETVESGLFDHNDEKDYRSALVSNTPQQAMELKRKVYIRERRKIGSWIDSSLPISDATRPIYRLPWYKFCEIMDKDYELIHTDPQAAIAKLTADIDERRHLRLVK